MATSGYTTTSSLSKSLNTMISSARVLNQQIGGMSKLCDQDTLKPGQGIVWQEISLGNLTAQGITEDYEHDNPQKIEDTLFSLETALVSIHTVITDRVKMRVSGNVYAQLGELCQNAITTQEDATGVLVLDGASTSLCGAGVTLTSGHISAAVAQIKGNSTEPGKDPIHIVLHSYQIKALKDEIIAGVGTYPITDGITADVYKGGNIPMVGGGYLFEDGNIQVSSDNAKGGAFAKRSIVIIRGISPVGKEIRNEKIGIGATEYIMVSEFVYGERSAGNWLKEIYSSAATPTG